jgi:TRAP-type C4-dicarboxylate transport system permease large subunit
MFIDSIAALILVVPLLLPIAQNSYDIDAVAFGVIVCINLVLGILTPPVGAGLFISAALSKVKPGQIFIALWPFLLVTVAVLMLLSWRPTIATLMVD